MATILHKGGSHLNNPIVKGCFEDNQLYFSWEPLLLGFRMYKTQNIAVTPHTGSAD